MMKIIFIDEKTIDYEPIDGKKIAGGQRGRFCKDIYFSKASSANYSMKDALGEANIIREYLGLTVFRALGVQVPNFNLGIIDLEDTSGYGGTLVFVQDYLEGTDENPICVNSDNLNELPLELLMPILIGSIIVGDVDGTGKNNDNFLIEFSDSDKKTPKSTYKIDCGRAFQDNFDPVDIVTAKQGYLGQFTPYLKNLVSDKKFIGSSCEFLSKIDRSRIEKDLRSAIEGFEKFIPRFECLAKYINSKKRDHYKDHGDVMALMQKVNVPTVDQLIEYVISRLDALSNHFSKTHENITKADGAKLFTKMKKTETTASISPTPKKI